jgi:hypothetical protein
MKVPAMPAMPIRAMIGPGELVAHEVEHHAMGAGDEAGRAELAVGFAAVPQSRAV